MSYIGTTKIGKMFLGSTEIAKAYLGTDLVFQKDMPPFVSASWVNPNGAAKIDTGIVLEAGGAVEVGYMLTNTSKGGDKMIIYGSGSWVETYGSSNTWYVRYGSSSSSSVSWQSADIEGTFRIEKNKFTVNGTQRATPNYSAMGSTSLCIGGRTANTGFSYVRIYSVKIWDGNSQLIASFVPKKRTSDGVFGLYNEIGGVFFRSDTGTDFVGVL